MPDSTLFHGIAVVIDDQIVDERSRIWQIQTEIKNVGCHVISMQDLPNADQLANMRSVSFFVVDWNLTATAIGDDLGVGTSLIPKDVLKRNAARIVEFLKELKKVRFAPVFIFTDQPVETVARHLKKHSELYDEAESTHIFIKSKADVLASGVFNVLSESLKNAPSAYVLKTWEREYERAKNALFLDFYDKSVYWPVLLWKTFQDDHVPPSIELGNLIGRNLLSRMTPFEFDLGPFEEALSDLVTDKENYRKLLLKVLEGERFLSKQQLHVTSVAPGDVFKQGKHYYINIRPDCDCISWDVSKQDAVELYLLEGSKLTEPQFERLYDSQYGLVRESDSQCIVFAIKDGATVSFAFKTLKVEPWGQWKDKRIGRLLPPFLTRLQQRYSDYLQRPGLTRIPQQTLKLHPKAETHIIDGDADKSTSGTTPPQSATAMASAQADSTPAAESDTVDNPTGQPGIEPGSDEAVGTTQSVPQEDGRVSGETTPQEQAGLELPKLADDTPNDERGL
jgi:hypothetical protein